MTPPITDYVPKIDRRTALLWLAGTLSAAACGDGGGTTTTETSVSSLPVARPLKKPKQLLGRASRVTHNGYGLDPNLTNPTTPWPRTMTQAQLNVTAALADIILPEDDRSPAASAVGVPDFIDEWVSAPYPQQAKDRELIFLGLEWLENTAQLIYSTGFISASYEQQTTLLDALINNDKSQIGGGGFALPKGFFIRFRQLAVGAYYTTEEGKADVGYQGNVAIAGDYPGPSAEALAHLNTKLAELGLAPR